MFAKEPEPETVLMVAIGLSVVAILGSAITIPLMSYDAFEMQTHFQTGMDEAKVFMDELWTDLMELKRVWSPGRRSARYAMTLFGPPTRAGREERSGIPGFSSPIGLSQAFYYPHTDDYEKQSYDYSCCDQYKNYCASGEPGAAGHPGHDAEDGEPGHDGSPGKSFDYSEHGEVTCQLCPPGPKGRYGRTGNRGTAGYVGLRGKPGKPGHPGLYGKVGYQGQPGYQSKKGKPGYPGLPGKKGYAGKGYPGKKGRRGPHGPPGVIGAHGRYGEEGAPGLLGWIGKKGYKGTAAPPGTKGGYGLKGYTGKPAHYCQCPTKTYAAPSAQPHSSDYGYGSTFDGGDYGNRWYPFMTLFNSDDHSQQPHQPFPQPKKIKWAN